MKFIYIFFALFVLLLALLFSLRFLDWRANQSEWKKLLSLQPLSPKQYTASMVADLPEPARRFFNFTISPGIPLYTVAEIDMKGQFSLGSKEKPNYQSMTARQILAAPYGFVWHLTLSGFPMVSGSDSARWTRFRILGLFPVARLGGDIDHSRAAYGRYIAESVFWTPAALLPKRGITWKGVDENTACVTVIYGKLSQSVNITVNSKGQPVEVSFLRWSNANPERKYRLQPFGGTLSDFHLVQGFNLPFKVEAGNMFATSEYFPFYKAEVQAIRFPVPTK